MVSIRKKGLLQKLQKSEAIFNMLRPTKMRIVFDFSEFEVWVLPEKEMRMP